MATSSPRATPEVHYPDSDGQPMGETGIHVNATIELFETLKDRYLDDRPDIYVASDMFFYYEKGNPRAVKAPDVMVIKGVSHPEERRSFKLWVEGRVPSVVFEITSEETSRDDTVVELGLYARLGIAEYFLFDPLGEYFDPPLRGYRLVADEYQPISEEVDEGLVSLELGLLIRAVDTRLRLFEWPERRLIPNRSENNSRARDADALSIQLIEERKGRQKFEKKARVERKKAQDERQKAEIERRKAEALAQEVARLRALLGEEADDPRHLDA